MGWGGIGWRCGVGVGFRYWWGGSGDVGWVWGGAIGGEEVVM